MFTNKDVLVKNMYDSLGSAIQEDINNRQSDSKKDEKLIKKLSQAMDNTKIPTMIPRTSFTIFQSLRETVDLAAVCLKSRSKRIDKQKEKITDLNEEVAGLEHILSEIEALCDGTDLPEMCALDTHEEKVTELVRALRFNKSLGERLLKRLDVRKKKASKYNRDKLLLLSIVNGNPNMTCKKAAALYKKELKNRS